MRIEQDTNQKKIPQPWKKWILLYSNYSDPDSEPDVADEPEDLEGFGSSEPRCDSARGFFERSPGE